MTEADEVLVQRSRGGERAAFEQIVHRTARLVYSRIVLDVSDRHKAEDLTQEVFLIAWRSIRSLGEPKALRGWLMAIASSVVADNARHGSRKKRGGPTSQLFDRVSDASIDPAAAAETSEEKQKALEALRSLPKDYRQALTLRYLAGADYDTIARQLALSNGSLRGLLHRGLALLRKRLSE